MDWSYTSTDIQKIETFTFIDRSHFTSLSLVVSVLKPQGVYRNAYLYVRFIP